LVRLLCFFMAIANIYFVGWFFGVRLVRCYSCDALFIFCGSCYFFVLSRLFFVVSNFKLLCGKIARCYWCDCSVFSWRLQIFILLGGFLVLGSFVVIRAMLYLFFVAVVIFLFCRGYFLSCRISNFCAVKPLNKKIKRTEQKRHVFCYRKKTRPFCPPLILALGSQIRY